MGTIIRDWNGKEIGEVPGKGENPMLVYGRTEGETCRNCSHLRQDWHNGKTYLKCDLRKLTRGAGSDHRAHWPACRKFESKYEKSEQ